MIVSMVLALQSISGLSNELPHEERLRFVFVRHDRGNPKVSGLSSVPTPWSRQSFFDIVEQCGGNKLTVTRSNGYRVIVTGESTANNVELARCVQSSTSVRFWVGVRESGLGAVSFDQQPFEQLWDS